jgi:tetratricopeptide (TPR) repeat protein
MNRNRTLSGNVYYQDTGAPAEHISVGLSDSQGEQHSPAITSASGFFEFRGLNLGSFEIDIDVRGYQPVRQSVDLVLTSTRGLAIYLKPLADHKTVNAKGQVSAHELSMPQHARDLVQAGKKKLYEDKDAQGALQDFEDAVTLAPGYYEAVYETGMAQLALANLAEAERSFRKSIEMSGDRYGEAEVALGALLLNRGETEAAEERIRRGVELNSVYWLGFYELGRAELVRDHVSEALKSAEQARSLAPDAPLVYRLLTKIHLRKQDYQAALGDLDAYLKLDPDSPLGIRAKQLRAQVAQKVAGAEAKQGSAAKP